MKKSIRQILSAALALTLAMGPAAQASVALGHDLHTTSTDLSVGTGITKGQFWSDTYSDLRTEHFLTYTPNSDVVPTVAYGNTIISRDTLSGMAKTLQNQGDRVVGGINGDYYAFATGAPNGIVITDGILRSAYSADSSLGSGAWYWGVGFRADGTAFIGKPAISIQATFGGQTYMVAGGFNKIRNGSSSYTLMNSDFATTTQNTSPGVDVILTPVTDNLGDTVTRADGTQVARSDQPVIGGRMTFTVEQVLESTGSIAIPEGKYILTVNNQSGTVWTDPLKALKPGDTVEVDFTSKDTTNNWAQAVSATGAPSRLVNNGQVDYSTFQNDSNANTRTARTAIGIKADGSVVFYTLDGGQAGYSVGCTLEQTAKRLIELGCVQAVALDGGGSTTLGATYPVDDSMGIQNKPSEGTQRSNSTAIFLTTDLQPTGELGSYYLEPRDNILLSGASVQFSAIPLDTAYFPMKNETGTELLYSLRNGDGTITADGRFTAGSEGGITEVAASDGRYEGSASVTVIKSPDTITVSRADTGAAITTLSLSPGEQMDLNASAKYRNLSLVSQDTCYTWKCSSNIGTIDANGVFTASDDKGVGSITVSAGGKQVTIQVNVAGHISTLESFEQEGPASIMPSETVQLTMEENQANVKLGAASLRMDYTTQEGKASLSSALTLPQGERYVGLWVKGDGSDNSLSIYTTNAAGEQEVHTVTGLNHTDWQWTMIKLPTGTTQITGFEILCGTDQTKGTLWIDQITSANQEIQDTTPPTVKMTLSGSHLTAVVSDDLDRTFSADQVVLTVDGVAANGTWNEGASALTADLNLSDGKAHRVTVTVQDASGNLGRGSADVASSVTAGTFSDMDDHWAATYAGYLYEHSVTNGVGGADGALLFQPDRNISRGEFFAMTARWMGLDLTLYEDTQLPFTDADAIPDWCRSEIKAMYALGILQGTAAADGSLLANPNASITRVEVMTVLGRTQQKGYATAPLTFTDASSVGSWALPYVETLVAQGVVSGYQNRINPNNPITRAEVAKLLYSML